MSGSSRPLPLPVLKQQPALTCDGVQLQLLSEQSPDQQGLLITSHFGAAAQHSAEQAHNQQLTDRQAAWGSIYMRHLPGDASRYGSHLAGFVHQNFLRDPL
jgi:hypothetical protein